MKFYLKNHFSVLENTKLLDYSPIILFVYKRIEETKKVIYALLANPEAKKSHLIIYCDGPKSDQDQEKVIAVQEFIKKIDGFYSKEIIIREINFGLAKSFIEGITETLKKYEYGIFLEDDNLVSSSFLKYMNLALLRYKDNVKVSCVTGYTYPIFPKSRKPYFLQGAETWSMGTWSRAWGIFNPDGKALLSEIKSRGLVSKLNQYGFQFYNMLEKQTRGEIDSWGIRWTASAVVKDLYCLYPPRPLCINIGFGADATHSKKKNLLMFNENSLNAQLSKYFPSKIKNKKSIKVRFILMYYRLIFSSKFS